MTARIAPAFRFVVLVKGKEQYVWAFRDGQQAAVCNSLGRMAADPELSLTWLDAARLSKQVRDYQEYLK